MSTVEEFERENFVPSKAIQWIASFGISLGAYGVGNICAWSAPALVDLENSGYFGDLTKEEITWAASIVPLAALSAGPLAGFLIDRLGRRVTILITSIPFLLGWLLIAFAPHITVLIVGRYFTGFCVGALSLTVPVYLAEITQEDIRGSVTNLYALMAGAGILHDYLFGWILSWYHLSLVNAVVPIALVLCIYFIPESPVFLLSKGKTDKARRALRWLRKAPSSEEIEPELQQLRRGIDDRKDRKLSAKEFFSSPVLKPNLICLVMMFLQQMSGINAVVFYTVRIFEAAGTDLDANIASIIVGLVLMLSIFTSSVLIDKLGRKVLLILSDGGMALGLFGLAVFFYLKETGTMEGNADTCGNHSMINYTALTESADHEKMEETLEYLTWLPLASLMFFVLCFNLGFGPVPFLYLGELLPAHVKGFGAGLATAFCWLLAFLVTKSFEDLVCIMGTYGCFCMFGVICVLGAIYCCLFVPETKGKTFDEIQQVFK